MHDSLCPNVPCNCEPDDWGHEWECSILCRCAEYAKVREEERMIRQEEKQISYLEGLEAAYRAVMETEAANTSEGAYVFRARAAGAIARLINA